MKTSVTIRFFTQFQTKIRANKLQEMLNVGLQDNYFSDLFIEIQVRQQMNFKFDPGCIFRKIGAVNKDIKSKRNFCRQSST